MNWLRKFLTKNGIYRAMLLAAGIMVALILGMVFGSEIF